MLYPWLGRYIISPVVGANKIAAKAMVYLYRTPVPVKRMYPKPETKKNKISHVAENAQKLFTIVNFYPVVKISPVIWH